MMLTDFVAKLVKMKGTRMVTVVSDLGVKNFTLNGSGFSEENFCSFDPMIRAILRSQDSVITISKESVIGKKTRSYVVSRENVKSMKRKAKPSRGPLALPGGSIKTQSSES
jgi:hypothetical protein